MPCLPTIDGTSQQKQSATSMFRIFLNSKVDHVIRIHYTSTVHCTSFEVFCYLFEIIPIYNLLRPKINVLIYNTHIDY